MRRLPRSPETADVLGLFTSLGQTHRFTLGDGAAHGEFVQLVGRSLRSAADNPIAVHGFRAQSMFSYVAASLGRARMIKQEDAGDVFVAEVASVGIPDFLVVLDDGSSFLVEVKNHRHPRKPLILKGTYLASLERYAQLVRRPLRIATYWSAHNLWSLISASRLPRDSTDARIDFPTAMKRNEMSDLGDKLVGTKPPLTLRMVTDPSQPRSVAADGEAGFTIGAVELRCAGRRVTSREERRLAFYFLCYSNWPLGEPKAFIRNNSLIHLDFEVAPDAPPTEQGFEMLGFLSSMISRRFNDLTAPTETVERLAPSASPGSLGVVVPENYKGRNLPLWRLEMRPNYEDE